MARIPLPDSGDPNDINVLRAVSNLPEARPALMALAEVSYSSPRLTPVERELAYLVASLANQCHY